MATGDRVDPYTQFNFLVEIDGVTRAGFTECGGLTSEQDIIEYREGSDPPHTRKIPGKDKNANITLKYGITKNVELWQWRKNIIDGTPDRRSGSIVLLDEGRQEVMRWNFTQGWISKWDGPALNANGNEIAIQTLEIAHEGLDLIVSG